MEFSTRPLIPVQTSQSTPRLGLHCDYGYARQAYALQASGCLLVALRASINVRCEESKFVIAPGQAYFVPPASRKPMAGLGNQLSMRIEPAAQGLGELMLDSGGAFLVMHASDVTWRVLFEQLSRSATELYPLAGLWLNSKNLGKALLTLVQRSRKRACALLEPADLFQLATAMRSSLGELVTLAERCPGRGLRQRLQVLSRLLRVRQLMSLKFTERLAVDDLAALANYSRAHFLHLYRLVFAQTPHATLVEQRLSLAQHLLSDRGFSVNEVTLATGFEDRSSFSKLYRQRFGITAMASKRAPKSIHRAF